MTPEEEHIARQPIALMEIDRLRLGGSARLQGADPEHVEAMAAVPGRLPPILVHRPTMRVIDGTHRIEAALRRGEKVIAGRFYDGSEDEAFVLSVSLNIAHGLPLSLADRKRAAERIAVSHPQWSDRRVAAVTGISAGTVADIRRRVTGAVEPGASRIGQDGRVRPLDCSAGRLLAGRLMTENPNLSLRQVAKAAAISPETARDVRNRLLNGAELVPARRGRGTRAPAHAAAATPAVTPASVPAAGQTPALPQAPARSNAPTPALAPPAGPPGGGKERRPLNLVRPGSRRELPGVDRAAIVNRLIGDPALRYTDTGRNLLRLLTLHTRWTEEWDTIVSNVPPHCTDAVADLARQFSDLWADFATRVDVAQQMAG